MWLRPDGATPTGDDWNRPDNRTVIALLTAGDTRAVLVFHAGREAIELRLPPARTGRSWDRLLETSPAGSDTAIAARSVTVFAETDGATTVAEGATEVGVRSPGQSPAAGDEDVDHLADLAGIDPVWWDIDGGRHPVTPDTKRALLAAMRLPADTTDDCRDSLARLTADHAAPLPPVVTVREGEPAMLTPRHTAPRLDHAAARGRQRRALPGVATAHCPCRRSRSAVTACCPRTGRNASAI